MPPIHHEVRDEYDQLAEEYDERWSVYVERTVHATLRYLDVPDDARILDIGCGTGALLSPLHQRQPALRLTGVDLSPSMLRIARQRLREDVRLVEASAPQLPFASASFDGVVSVSSFHYWPTPIYCLSETKRILRPGGSLFLTDWCDDYLACKLCGIYLHLTGQPHSHIFGSRDCQDLLDEAGFQSIEMDRYRISWIWGMMTVTALRP